MTRLRVRAVPALVLTVALGLAGCGWRGLNSVPLPGTAGGGPGTFSIQAQMPDVTNLQPNSRVRVGDVNVGTVTNVTRQGWHALLTIRLDGDVQLPANATATIGQTSLLGSMHVELAAPTDTAPQGRLQDGTLIPLDHSASYPTTEQTLAAVSLLLNGGGVGQLQDITFELSTALRGRENDMRSLITELDTFIARTNEQTGDIIAATDDLNRLTGKFAAQKPVLDNALRTIPDALKVLAEQRDNLAEALDQVGRFSALAADSTRQTKDALVQELNDIHPVLQSLADAGPDMTRSLSMLSTFPFPNETLENWMRGDYANMTAIVDLTLSRIDSGLFTGTRFEGELTELEMQWGRTIGQFPSPYTTGNPLVIPYRWNQGALSMHLHRHNKIQLAVFTVIALVFGSIMAFGYMKLPAKLFDVGRYFVTLELAQTGGLYPTGNVTYRGTEVGRVESVGLRTGGGVQAVLSLKSGIAIPSDLVAEIHSQSAIGEQYVELLPRNGTSAPLKDGDVIRVRDTFVPPDINSLLGAANTGLEAIPRDNLKTAVDEAYAAVGGLGPEIARLVKGSTALASEARANLDPLTTLIDQWQPVADSQSDTADEIEAWAANIATVTQELQHQDAAVAGLIENGAPAADEARQLFERLQPTLPILLANLVSLGEVAVTYQPNLEQLLVLLPQGIASLQGINVANRNTEQDYKGAYLSFNLNINLPPVCSTGFLPAQQRRAPSLQDYPDRPAGDLYCRTPQDSVFNVRGARNAPCETVPGKRAATVAMCESDETFVPLNEGFNWKGDPNATLSGQAIPELPPAATPPPPPVAVVPYDPATGSYVAPDGRVYTQADLAQNAPKHQTWQSMLIPPPG